MKQMAPNTKFYYFAMIFSFEKMDKKGQYLKKRMGNITSNFYHDLYLPKIIGIGGVFSLGWILNDYWFRNLRPLSFSSTFNTSPLNSGIHLDNINSAGQPVLDLHSALNNIHKSFSLGSGNRSRLNHNRSNFSNSLQVYWTLDMKIMVKKKSGYSITYSPLPCISCRFRLLEEMGDPISPCLRVPHPLVPDPVCRFGLP